MNRFLIPAVVGAVTLGAAVAHGSRTGRWTPLPPLDAYTAKLAGVPLAVGDWAGEDVPLADAESLGRAGIAGHLHRRYAHKSSGEAVTVLVVCGRPGPIAVHTPDVCYRGAGYVGIGDPEKSTIELADRKVGCQRMQFKPPAARPGSGNLDIRWAWVADAGVEAPEYPRAVYSQKPALYKVYVIRETAPQGSPKRDDPAGPFLKAFVPALEDALKQPG